MSHTVMITLNKIWVVKRSNLKSGMWLAYGGFISANLANKNCP